MLELLSRPGFFAFGSEGVAAEAYLKSELKNELGLHSLRHERLIPSTMMLPKNSPLTRMFNRGKELLLWHTFCMSESHFEAITVLQGYSASGRRGIWTRWPKNGW